MNFTTIFEHQKRPFKFFDQIDYHKRQERNRIIEIYITTYPDDTAVICLNCDITCQVILIKQVKY